jgi:hypothetical protein
MAVAAGMIAQLVKLTLIAVHVLSTQSFGAAQSDVAANGVLRRAEPVVLLVLAHKPGKHGLHRGCLTHHSPPGL